MRPLATAMALVPLSLLLPGPASAVSFAIPTSFGFGADTHVNLGTGGANQNGGAIANGVQTQLPDDFASPNDAQPILRFDLSGLPAGPIVDAFFTFSVRFVANTGVGGMSIAFSSLEDVADPVDPSPLDAAPGSGGWTELGITGNTAPAFDGQIGSDAIFGNVPLTEGNLVPTLAHFGEEPGAFKTNLVARLNEDTNGLVSFRLVALNGSTSPPFPSFSFYSKEGVDAGFLAAVAPTLTVTVPEPSRAWLLIVAGLALFQRRPTR